MKGALGKFGDRLLMGVNSAYRGAVQTCPIKLTEMSDITDIGSKDTCESF